VADRARSITHWLVINSGVFFDDPPTDGGGRVCAISAWSKKVLTPFLFLSFSPFRLKFRVDYFRKSMENRLASVLGYVLIHQHNADGKIGRCPLGTLFRLIAIACLGATVLLPLHGQDKGLQKRDADREAVETFLKRFSEPVQIRGSKPVTTAGARFEVFVQTDWKPPRPSELHPMVAPIQVQMRISNLSKTEVLFATLRAIGVRILNADGRELEARTEGISRWKMRPFLLDAGESHVLSPRAELRTGDAGHAPEFVFHDGSGVKTIIGPLLPGLYKLLFSYSVPANEDTKADTLGGGARWTGSVVSNVVVEVLESRTRGNVSSGPECIDAGEILRLRESKPVTADRVGFTAAAQRYWVLGKLDWAPIEMQLRIMNLGEDDLILPTFDTFGIVLEAANGKKLAPRGGRDLTMITRPILVPRGASFSLARKAELRLNPETKQRELAYFDGTGRVAIFGPLDAGSYKLAFGYRVAGQQLRTKAGDSRTWVGSVITDNVIVDVLDR
jgi:hypothetical protein